MKRSPLKRKTPFRSKREGPSFTVEAKPRATPMQPATLLHRGTYGPVQLTAAPKTEPWRCPALLTMARGRACLLNAVEGCRMAGGETTVAAHSNLGIHGKAKGRKADDCYSVWSCDRCHAWLDQGSAPRDAKESAFMRAHMWQVVAWRAIATSESEPARLRKAARAALERLGASPLPLEPMV